MLFLVLCSVLEIMMSVNQEITSEAKTPWGKNKSIKNSRDQGTLKHQKYKHKEKVQTFSYIFCNP